MNFFRSFSGIYSIYLLILQTWIEIGTTFTTGKRLRPLFRDLVVFVALFARNHIKGRKYIFTSPTRTIGFNPQLKLNDGVLVQSYMSAYDTSFADASRIVEKASKRILSVSFMRKESPSE